MRNRTNMGSFAIAKLQAKRHSLLAIALVAVLGLVFTTCKDPDDTTTGKTLTGITLNTASVKKAYVQNDALDLSGLVVTAAYSDSTSAEVTNYTASPENGTALSAVETKTVTISFSEGGVTKTANFDVTVAAPVPADITYTVTQTGGTDGTADTTGITFTFSASVDSLNLTAANINVSGAAAKAQSATFNKSGSNWLLSPVTVSAAGNAAVSITKTGIEAGAKPVMVYMAGQTAPTLTGITAVYNQTTTVYPTTPLNDLKAELTVTAAYSNGTNTTVTDYTLGGTLAVGTSTVTVTYEGKTAQFTVTVTAAATTVSVTGVTLDQSTLNLTVGGTATLTPNVAPSNATNKAVTWSSSDPAVAAVSGGVVSAVSAGTATITVTTADGGKTAECNVTVTAAATTVSVTGVTLDQSTLNLTVGGTATLTPNVEPSNATNKAVTWSSSDPAVAAVSGGVVSAVGAGTATITVTTADGGETAECEVTVTKAEGAAVDAPTAASKTSNSITVNAAAAPDNGQSVEYAISTANNETGLSEWQSGTAFTGLNSGTAYYVYARSAENNNYNAGEASVSGAINTTQTFSKEIFAYYWVNTQDELIMIDYTGEGAITLTPGQSLTITAQGWGYANQQWYLNGINTGATGTTYTFSRTTAGKYTVGLFVQKDGKWYNANIAITVAE